MLKTYEFKLQPTKCQKQRLVDMLDAARYVYNWGLEDRVNMYRYAKYSTSFYDQSKYLKELRKEKPWLEDVHVHVLQGSLKRLDLAFKAFFRRLKNGEKPGFPRFKGQYFFNSFSFKEYGNGFGLQGKRLSLSKIGRIRINLHREIIGEIKTCIVKRKADGWYAFLGVEVPEPKPSQLDNPVGLDLGLNSFAVLSDGEKIKNPRLLKKALDEVKHEQRLLDNKERASKRRAKQREKLARKHLKVERHRRDFHFKLANMLVENFNPIVVEDLDIMGLIRKAVEDKRNGKKVCAKSENILDAGWGLFLQRLGSKAANAGSAIKAVEPRGTSQECCRCGKVVRKGLDERVHDCPFCGLVIDRDVNAAINILKRWLIAMGRIEEAERLGKEMGWAAPSGMVPGRELVQANREAAPL